MQLMLVAGSRARFTSTLHLFRNIGRADFYKSGVKFVNVLVFLAPATTDGKAPSIDGG